MVESVSGKYSAVKLLESGAKRVQPEFELSEDNLFDVVISSADVGYAKPEEEIYRFALEQLALPPEAALFIDDLPRNTLAAEQIGIATIVFTTPSDLVEELKCRSIL